MMDETGCSTSLALNALRLIISRRRPRADRLRGYLAKFTPAHRSYWINQALATERGAMAAILMGELVERFSAGPAVPSEATRQADAERVRREFLRAYPAAEPRQPRGMQLLDAALQEIHAGGV